MRRNSGFTLVEILIVVIILGILAAIVIPQFTEASSNARLSSLTSDLQTVRSQIELYKLQHGDRSPDQDIATGGTVDLFGQLEAVTDGTGAKVATTVNPHFGPYLQKSPINPFVNNSVKVTVANAMPGDGGWWFDTTMGQFKGLGKDPTGGDIATLY
jgi:general secretion pathway protein G